MPPSELGRNSTTLTPRAQLEPVVTLDSPAKAHLVLRYRAECSFNTVPYSGCSVVSFSAAFSQRRLHFDCTCADQLRCRFTFPAALSQHVCTSAARQQCWQHLLLAPNWLLDDVRGCGRSGWSSVSSGCPDGYLCVTDSTGPGGNVINPRLAPNTASAERVSPRERMIAVLARGPGAVAGRPRKVYVCAGARSV